MISAVPHLGLTEAFLFNTSRSLFPLSSASQQAKPPPHHLIAGSKFLDCWADLSSVVRVHKFTYHYCPDSQMGMTRPRIGSSFTPQMFENIKKKPGWESAGLRTLPSSRLWRLSDDGSLRVKLTKSGKEQEPKKSQLPPLR